LIAKVKERKVKKEGRKGVECPLILGRARCTNGVPTLINRTRRVSIDLNI
jgi:hypothetical protein